MNKVYKGDVRVTKENEQTWQQKLKNIATVSGSIDVSDGATLIAPKLARSDYIDVSAGATLIAPKLARSGSV